MIFSINYDLHPINFLKKLDKSISKRIINKIEELLTNNPVPHTAISIVGEHGVFRIGDYRAIYGVDYEKNKIVIIKVDKRSKVYE